MTVLTYGEALLRLSLPPATLLEDISTLEVFVGGAELNVACALARLGTPARYFTTLPIGALGERVRREVRVAGVETSALASTEGRLGTYYLEDHFTPRPSRVVYDRLGSTHQLQQPSDDVLYAALEGISLLHFTGINLALGGGSAQTALRLLALAQAANIPVSFDVNHRRSLMADAQAALAYAKVLAGLSYLFVAERDLALFSTQAGLEAAVDDLRRQAPEAMIIVTRGEGGSVGYAPDGEAATAPALRAAGAGRIGRGDAFCASFLHATLQGGTLADSLAFASAAAALKTTTAGDQLRATSADVHEVLAGADTGSEPRR